MVLSFLLFSISYIVLELHYISIPHWLSSFNMSAPWDYSYAIKDIFHYTSTVLILISVVKLIQQKEISMIKTLKFPILFFISSQTFWFVFSSISTEFSFFTLNGSNKFWYSYPLFFLKFIVLGLIIVHFSQKTTAPIQVSSKQVSKGARFINSLIDSLLIFAFVMSNLMGLSKGFIFESIPYFNDSPYWYYFLNMFAYFFVLEILFLQTIGKLHNNSVVHYEGNRFVRILFRTMGRFIPFDALSFLGSKGFHDSVSKTTVVLQNDDMSEDSDVSHLIPNEN